MIVCHCLSLLRTDMYASTVSDHSKVMNARNRRVLDTHCARLAEHHTLQRALGVSFGAAEMT